MKRETWHVVAYILQHFTTLFFVMSYFWLGGGPKCNLQFVTPVVMVCCILKAPIALVFLKSKLVKNLLHLDFQHYTTCLDHLSLHFSRLLFC